MLEGRVTKPDIHLNLNVRGMGASATVAINEHCDALRRSGREVFKLGLGQSPFPVPERVVEALRQHAHEKDYLPVRGLPALREAVADYHRRREGLARSGEDVLIGPGSKELMFLLQLVYYGDLVIPTPAWVSYAPQARVIGRQVRMIATHASEGWRLTAERLQALCEEDPERPRVVILNYPANPTGGSYSVEELQALAEMAARYRVVLLSDEIYGELHHRGEHASIARFYPEGTIISSGLSKWCGAGGWRVGTFLFPPGMRWLLEAMAAAASETYTSTCAPVQYASVAAFGESPELERYLETSRRVLHALGVRIHQQLVGAGLHCAEPAGGFYLFPDFGSMREGLAARGVETSEALCKQLLEDTGVAILPGSAFGRPEAELTTRLAYVDFDGAAALEAAAGQPLNGAFLEARCARVVEAVERLVRWLP